jgi:hypothetical protein
MELADFNRQSQTSIARKKGEELERKKLFPGKLQVIIEQMLWLLEGCALIKKTDLSREGYNVYIC